MSEFVALHTLDGRDVYINPALVTTVGEARDPDDPKKQLTGDVHCVVNLADGKFVTVIERCDSVRDRLEK
jgi:hypothetical protein